MHKSITAPVPLTFPSVPGTEDQLFADYFHGTQQREIRLPYCSSCTQFHWYPMMRCPYCGNSAWRWRRIRPVARLFTWTILRRALDPELMSLVGQTVALVVPDDAPNVRLVASLMDVEEPSINMPLKARFVDAGGVVLPVFEAAKEE